MGNCACKDCYCATPEYKEALEKVKANNPQLIVQQEKNRKRKNSMERRDNIIRVICLILSIIDLSLCLLGIYAYIYENASFSLGALTINADSLILPTAVIVGVIIVTTMLQRASYSSFWEKMADDDYQLYTALKKEFEKVGYNLP